MSFISAIEQQYQEFIDYMKSLYSQLKANRLSHEADLDSMIKNFEGTPFSEIADILRQDPHGLYANGFLEGNGVLDSFKQLSDFIGQGDWTGVQGWLASNPSAFKFQDSSDFQSWLNNKISQQNIDTANEYQAGREDTALIRQAEQLGALGLGTSGVLSLGGAGSGSAGAASVDRSSAQHAAAMETQKFQAKQMLVRSMLRSISGMASAGIGGGALLLSKNAVKNVAKSAASSMLTVSSDLNKLARHQRFVEHRRTEGGKDDDYDWDTLIAGLEGMNPQ